MRSCSSPSSDSVATSPFLQPAAAPDAQSLGEHESGGKGVAGKAPLSHPCIIQVPR